MSFQFRQEKMEHKIFVCGNAKSGPRKKGGNNMDSIALILSVIGCLNWGLIGIFQFDLVAWLFGGQGSLFSRLVYTLVGLAGIWCATFLFRRNVLVEGE